VERFAGDMSQLEYNEDGDLLYNGNVYYRADDRFEVRTGEGDKVIELGWRSQFPFFPDMHYYTFDEDNPLFIFCENGESTLYTKGVYVRSDYDLYTQVYTVENSNIEIPIVSAMTQSDVEATAIDHETYIYLKMFLKDNPCIQIELSGPYQYDNHWYFIHAGETWIISDEFVAMLKANNIVNK
jgi:hypothetical protein